MEKGGLLVVSCKSISTTPFPYAYKFFTFGGTYFFSVFGLVRYLRMLAVSYEKTQELARDLRAMGCGDLDVEGNFLGRFIHIILRMCYLEVA